MESTSNLRMKLATILGTKGFCQNDAQNLIELTQYITEERHEEFYLIVSDRLRDELIFILDDDDLDPGFIRATTLGNAAVLDWLAGNSENLVRLVLDCTDPEASRVALQTLETCYFVAEHSVRTLNRSVLGKSKYYNSSSAATGLTTTPVQID